MCGNAEKTVLRHYYLMSGAISGSPVYRWMLKAEGGGVLVAEQLSHSKLVSPLNITYRMCLSFILHKYLFL